MPLDVHYGDTDRLARAWNLKRDYIGYLRSLTAGPVCGITKKKSTAKPTRTRPISRVLQWLRLRACGRRIILPTCRSSGSARARYPSANALPGAGNHRGCPLPMRVEQGSGRMPRPTCWVVPQCARSSIEFGECRSRGLHHMVARPETIRMTQTGRPENA